MKRKILIACITLITLLWISPTEAYSQRKGGGPPPWAPAHGYRAKTRHIYFPDQNFYFDMQKGMYIYLNNGKWMFAAKLPSIFGGINLSKAAQVELELDNHNPHHYNSDHRVKYKVKHKPAHKGNDKHHGHGNGRGNSNGKGNGKGNGNGKGKGR